MKHDKELSKADHRFKSKIKSLKISSNSSAVERARTFFRVFDHKRHHDNEQSSSSSAICQSMATNDASVLIHGKTSNQDFFLSPIARKTNISITKSMKVDKINPRDMIVYRVVHNDQNDERFMLNYFQKKYRQYMKPSLLYPKQYYQSLLSKTNYTYATSFDKRGSSLRTSLPTFGSNSARIHPPRNDTILSPYRFSNALYENSIRHSRPNESAFLVPSSATQLVRPSPSSMVAWNQCVDRLNTEYRSTIEALQQAKEYLEELYVSPSNTVSKYASIVARGIDNLSNNESKKSVNVTFCLPPLIKPEKTVIEQSKVESWKPKLVKPIELNTFSTYDDSSDEKSESISTIIQKFNNLSTTMEKGANAQKSDPSFLLSKFDSIKKVDPVKTKFQEEETTYTIETLYKRANDRNSFTDDEPLIITRENATAEQFNSICDNKQQVQTTDTNSQSSLTNTSKFISQIPKRTASTMHGSRLISSTVSSSLSKSSPAPTNNDHKTNTSDSTISIRKNYVKSIVRQLNTSASTSSTSLPNKQNGRRVSIQPTTFNTKK
ncbi:unnamed protein product [Adineta ricciae]|uniref:Uncharacterized protein n=1 Tax=Adineta ricciae TaxID=249248 RepID=A0A814PGD3_ADIRI|nr:unnamed protein product [Adineta ricciae]CAF1346943.1 unnamed protein product [Adineta ricciae]